MKPVGKNVLVEKIPIKETTKAGVILPFGYTFENYQRGKVLRIGSKVRHLKIGQYRMYHKNCGLDIEIEGKDCILLNERHFI